MKWYTVEETFMDYLRSHEQRIPRTNYGADRFKPFFGQLFEISELVYITQVSHPKTRHFSMKDDVDFIKLYHGTRLIGVVNLNYMFPVNKNHLIDVEYKNIESFRTFKDENQKNDYIALMKREMKAMMSKNLGKMALDLYNQKNNYPTDRVSNRCFDFKYLEKRCIEYTTQKIQGDSRPCEMSPDDPT